MAGPSWLADTFAAIMIVVAGYCASRLVLSRLWRRQTEIDGDGMHVVMGVAMAGMLVARLNPLPAPVWEAGFAVTAAWFGSQAFRAYRGQAISARWCPHPVPHLVESAAMLYMFLAVSATRSGGPGGGMAGMGTSSGSVARFPALGLALALFMIGYVVWTADRITPLTAARPAIPAAVSAASATQEPAARFAPLTATGAQATASTRAAADTGPAPSPAPAPGRRAGPGPFLAPRCLACCRIAMGVTMGYLLITML
ncbi:MAG TPA: DUF5134 domain-containing protein [Streptosporangiaceae bacterium]|nr:DUF5134 domain-containing protein [Streptosporangiaceae bacterium]